MHPTKLVICENRDECLKALKAEVPLGETFNIERLRYWITLEEVKYDWMESMDDAFRHAGALYTDIEYRTEVRDDIKRYLKSRVRALK